MASIFENSQRVVAEAIAAGNETGSHHLPSLGSQPEKVEQDQINYFSPEDLDWVDSCLNDPDASQIDWASWDSFSCALSEILISETESPEEMTEDHLVETSIDLSCSSLQMESTKVMDTRADERADENSEDQMILTDILHSCLALESCVPPILFEKCSPTATEECVDFPGSVMDIRGDENSEDPMILTNILHSRLTSESCVRVPPILVETCSPTATEECADFPGSVIEDSIRGDIFKVWDLNLPNEEDDYIDQLVEGFAQSSLIATPGWRDADGSRMLKKGLEDAALDSIISGISNISL